MRRAIVLQCPLRHRYEAFKSKPTPYEVLLCARCRSNASPVHSEIWLVCYYIRRLWPDRKIRPVLHIIIFFSDPTQENSQCVRSLSPNKGQKPSFAIRDELIDEAIISHHHKAAHFKRGLPR